MLACKIKTDAEPEATSSHHGHNNPVGGERQTNMLYKSLIMDVMQPTERVPVLTQAADRSQTRQQYLTTANKSYLTFTL